jgi:hypothetical protein
MRHSGDNHAVDLSAEFHGLSKKYRMGKSFLPRLLAPKKDTVSRIWTMRRDSEARKEPFSNVQL